MHTQSCLVGLVQPSLRLGLRNQCAVFMLPVACSRLVRVTVSFKGNADHEQTVATRAASRVRFYTNVVPPCRCAASAWHAGSRESRCVCNAARNRCAARRGCPRSSVRWVVTVVTAPGVLFSYSKPPVSCTPQPGRSGIFASCAALPTPRSRLVVRVSTCTRGRRPHTCRCTPGWRLRRQTAACIHAAVRASRAYSGNATIRLCRTSRPQPPQRAPPALAWGVRLQHEHSRAHTRASWLRCASSQTAGATVARSHLFVLRRRGNGARVAMAPLARVLALTVGLEVTGRVGI